MSKEKKVHKAVRSAVNPRKVVFGQDNPEQGIVNTKFVTPREGRSKISQRAITENALSRFNELPDCGYVRLPVVLALFGCARATLWRWVKAGRVPSPIKLGHRISGWNVGLLRAYLNNIQLSGQIGLKVGGE